jgi:hypothetical protein
VFFIAICELMDEEGFFRNNATPQRMILYATSLLLGIVARDFFLPRRMGERGV